MEKKPQNTAGNENENPAPQGSKWPDETIIRYITRALVLLIVFAWALVNLDAVLRFLGKVLALFTPFLIGGPIAFLINVVLRPLECCWNKVCRKAPAKLTRSVCLTASTVLVLGIPYAGAVSAFVAVTALVPIFGAWIGGGLGAFLILLAEPGKALWFILFLLILQQVEGNLIYPKVVGKSVGLPGLLVLMAVTIGGEAFGILGMLFSVPVCAVLYSLYLEFMKKASARH